MKNKMEPNYTWKPVKLLAGWEPAQSAMCLSAVSPSQSTPGESPEEPPSPSGCEDVIHLQPHWGASPRCLRR